jgi:hypothetical protein
LLSTKDGRFTIANLSDNKRQALPFVNYKLALEKAGIGLIGEVKIARVGRWGKAVLA